MGIRLVIGSITVGSLSQTSEEVITQYEEYTDGVNTVRQGVRDGAFVQDIALTETGFSGEEGIDWENVRSFM